MERTGLQRVKFLVLQFLVSCDTLNKNSPCSAIDLESEREALQIAKE